MAEAAKESCSVQLITVVSRGKPLKESLNGQALEFFGRCGLSQRAYHSVIAYPYILLASDLGFVGRSPKIDVLSHEDKNMLTSFWSTTHNSYLMKQGNTGTLFRNFN